MEEREDHDQEVGHQQVATESNNIEITLEKITEIKVKSTLHENVTVDCDGKCNGGWYYGEDNPDLKLAVMQASNQGLRSKMRADTGSSYVSKLVQKV